MSGTDSVFDADKVKLRTSYKGANSRLFAGKWAPFVRAGYADDGGALWEKSVSAGLGYNNRKSTDLIGIGLNWSRPLKRPSVTGWTISTQRRSFSFSPAENSDHYAGSAVAVQPCAELG